ncbi:fused DSP-PTPase phosphatase/NAD kinase-like protein [Phenylobacterium montanum]|uniref:Protein tyrosine phosphatase n=1 Tax=Phenylobacterium montanum TaxID=2823693 RepID=A0A975FXV1_9CAUL|nr:protein tyrosine phosphatase [Caulobacter sp. S6]QUD87214.1 protein tyrosine phosphatase [Caulobacter sp. S6]
MKTFDLSTPAGRFATYVDYNLNDHAFLRLRFQNAHWLGDRLVRTNQPWPFQLKRWRDKGVRTVINLRGGFDASFYALERDACARLGLKLIDFTVRSRAAPSREQILGARDMFAQLEYPALMHCKSGADRASLMSVLYAHFQLGWPISQAVEQLSFRYLHMKTSKTGVLDHVFATYLSEAEPRGISFLDWVMSDAYDADALTREFHAGWWGNLLADKILRRE